jgi:tRNA U34 5-methylaminomethyl-2-thiouridine-forming methyltransferase MnmC
LVLGNKHAPILDKVIFIKKQDVPVLALKETLTKDGSMTFYSEEYGETYHSSSGAVEEAFLKHAKPGKVNEVAKTGKVRILDVCFGLGYNSAAALDLIWAENPDCYVEIVGLEKDEKILLKALSLNPNIRNYGLIKSAISQGFQSSLPKLKINILKGDAREQIKKLNGTFDVIFHDPFSPTKNPELWTEDFFKSEKQILSPDGILTTYSCARLIRDNLKKAGFIVSDGPCVGRRAPSTIATLKGTQ